MYDAVPRITPALVALLNVPNFGFLHSTVAVRDYVDDRHAVAIDLHGVAPLISPGNGYLFRTLGARCKKLA